MDVGSLEMIDEQGRRTEVAEFVEHSTAIGGGRRVKNYVMSLPLDSTVHPGMKARVVDRTTGETICELRVINIGTKFKGGQILVVTGEGLCTTEGKTEVVEAGSLTKARRTNRIWPLLVIGAAMGLFVLANHFWN